MGDRFRILFIGQAAFGESVLNALVAGGEDIAGVFCPPDKPGKSADPIVAAAEQHGLPLFRFPRMRAPEAIAAAAGLKADLGVMAFVTDIVPEAILNAPRLGTIQYHPSLLPKHRGPSSINWPIIQGEGKTGLSVFWPDAGLDTGPILMQKDVTIGPDDTLGTVYFDKLFPLGVEAMVESVRLVKAGTAPKLPQDEIGATYEGWCKAADCSVDWTRPSEEVHNLIRGADPSPGANTTFDGGALGLFGSRLFTGSATGAPGSVLAVEGDAIVVACGTGAVSIGKVRGKDGKKAPAASAGLKAGDCLGS